LEHDAAEENMRCKRRGESSPMGAANCPKDFFSGKKGTKSPYFKKTKESGTSPYLEHW